MAKCLECFGCCWCWRHPPPLPSTTPWDCHHFIGYRETNRSQVFQTNRKPRYRKVFNQQHVEPRVRRVALNRGVEYLEQDFRLIAFAAYLGSEAFDGFCGQGESRMTFKVWLHQRPEVQTMK